MFVVVYWAPAGPPLEFLSYVLIVSDLNINVDVVNDSFRDDFHYLSQLVYSNRKIKELIAS